MDDLYRAKRPRSIIAGPYGHPFHSILVTIPIGAWIASFVFDIVSLVNDDPDAFTRGAALLIAIGLVGALAAAVVGLLDYSQLSAGTKARKVATAHLALNLSAIALFVINLVVRAPYDEVSVLGIVLSVVALLGLGVSGFLGGELAYRFGVRVADEQTQRTGFDAR